MMGVRIMNLESSPLVLEQSLSDPQEWLDQIEQQICGAVRQRVRNFQIQALSGGLVLEGRSKTYYAKQKAQHAVTEATGRLILVTNIVVGRVGRLAHQMPLSGFA